MIKMAMGSPRRRFSAVSLAAGIVTIALAGCGSGPSTEPTTTSSTNATAQVAVTLDERAASLVPAEYKGKPLSVALGVGSMPWSDFTEDRTSFRGLNIDLMDAASTVLGTEIKYEATNFANMIPGVQGGRYDIAVASIFDNAEREKIVDAVSYSADGHILIGKKGGKTELTEDSMCGIKVGVVSGSIQANALPARTEKCLADGKQGIEMLTYPDLSDAILAVTSGRSEVLNINTSIGDYLVQTRPETFQAASGPYQSVPIAMVLKKGSPLSPAIAEAINVLIENGKYTEIFDKWGMRARVDEAKINPATTGK